MEGLLYRVTPMMRMPACIQCKSAPNLSSALDTIFATAGGDEPFSTTYLSRFNIFFAGFAWERSGVGTFASAYALFSCSACLQILVVDRAELFRSRQDGGASAGFEDLSSCSRIGYYYETGPEPPAARVAASTRTHCARRVPIQRLAAFHAASMQLAISIPDSSRTSLA